MNTPSPSATLAMLRDIVGTPHITATPQQMQPYLTDWRGRYQGTALAVVQPETSNQVSNILRYCHTHRIAVVPQGGNTSLCGGATPDNSGNSIVLSTARLNRLRHIDAHNNTMTIEAGCTLAQAQHYAQQHDRLFPLSLASEGSCQIGGNISTNAGGVHVIRYGNMRDLVLGLEVVLPDGQVWNGLRTLRKDNTGYDLKHCFIGAEGTLGLITAASLKLFPRPTAIAAAWAAVACPEDALTLLNQLRASCGDTIHAFELIHQDALRLVLTHIPATTAPLPTHYTWHLLIEVRSHGDDATLRQQLEEALHHALQQHSINDVAIATRNAHRDAFWKIRESISDAQRYEGLSIKHDISLPLHQIPTFLYQSAEQLQRNFSTARIVTFGHLGDGNLHYNISCHDKQHNTAWVKQYSDEINQQVYQLVNQLDGSISAEHGIGQLKQNILPQYLSDTEILMMKQIKHSLDPKNIMNPGKIL